jgi:hypothetical protein
MHSMKPVPEGKQATMLIFVPDSVPESMDGKLYSRASELKEDLPEAEEAYVSFTVALSQGAAGAKIVRVPGIEREHIGMDQPWLHPLLLVDTMKIEEYRQDYLIIKEFLEKQSKVA